MLLGPCIRVGGDGVDSRHDETTPNSPNVRTVTTC